MYKSVFNNNNDSEKYKYTHLICSVSEPVYNFLWTILK